MVSSGLTEPCPLSQRLVEKTVNMFLSPTALEEFIKGATERLPSHQKSILHLTQLIDPHQINSSVGALCDWLYCMTVTELHNCHK